MIRSGNQAVTDATITSGGIFDNNAEISCIDDGTLTLTFDDCHSGTVEYELPPINAAGTLPIQRAVEDNTALCEVLLSQ